MKWQIFLWPLKPTGVFLILAYTVIGWVFLFFIDFYFTIEPLTRWFSIGFSLPGWYMIAASLALYAHKMFTHVSRGLFGQRMQQETDVNPFQSFMAFKLWILMAGVFGLVLAIGETPTLATALLPALFFPVLWLGVMTQESFPAARHPRNIGSLRGGRG